MMRPWGGIEWEGAGDRVILEKLRRMVVETPAIAAEVLAAEGAIELLESDRRTPFDQVNDRNPVHLRETSRLEGPALAAEGIEVTLVIGGASVGAPYAVKQHQAHYRHAEGQREYLLSVMEESKRFLAGRIVRRLEARLGTVLRG